MLQKWMIKYYEINNQDEITKFLYENIIDGINL